MRGDIIGIFALFYDISVIIAKQGALDGEEQEDMS